MSVANTLRPARARAFSLVALIVVLDQIVKYLMVAIIRLPERGADGFGFGIPFFRFTFAMNEGVSYGLLTAGSETQRWLLVALTGAISLAIAVWIWRERNRGDGTALGLILGGAVGNLIDRARLGYVIDYADFHVGAVRPFAIFNLADAAISLGVVLLLVRAFFLRERV